MVDCKDGVNGSRNLYNRSAVPLALSTAPWLMGRAAELAIIRGGAIYGPRRRSRVGRVIVRTVSWPRGLAPGRGTGVRVSCEFLQGRQ